MWSSKSTANLRWRLAQRLEVMWWRRYLSARRPDHYLTWKQAYWEDLLAQMAWYPPADARVLDVGCGPAGVFLALPTQNITAVDPLLDDYREMQHFRQAQRRGITWICQPLESYTTGQPFEWVSCLNAINHVADLEQCVHRLADAMAPGGRLLLSTDVHRSRYCARVFRWLPGDALHPQQYTMAGYERLFEQAGLKLCDRQQLGRQWLFDYVAWIWTKA